MTKQFWQTWFKVLHLLIDGHEKRESALLGAAYGVSVKRVLSRGRVILKVG